MKQLISGTNAYKMMKNAAERGSLSHAYLLLFPDDKNLRFVLKEFAFLIMKADEEEKTRIEKGSYPDVLIYPEEGKKWTAELAEEIPVEANIKPLEGDKKLFVLDRFHEASAVVQNKLLKVIEEPPEGVSFLIGATGEHNVLPTVISRTEGVRIPPFSDGEIEDFLRRNYPEKENLSEFAVGANGSVGRAQQLIEGGDYAEYLALAFDFALSKEGDIPFLVDKASAIKQKTEFLFLLKLVFRDAMMYNLNGEILLKSEKERIKACVKRYSVADCVKASESILKAEKDVKFNAYFPMTCEVLLQGLYKEKK